MRSEERKMLRTIEVSRLFEFPERIQLIIEAGQGITKWMCQDVKRARFLWRETGNGISLRRAKKLWEDAKRV